LTKLASDSGLRPSPKGQAATGGSIAEDDDDEPYRKPGGCGRLNGLEHQKAGSDRGALTVLKGPCGLGASAVPYEAILCESFA